MTKHLVARASVVVNADRDAVWEALTRPELIRRYMFGATVVTSWEVGDPIVWRGVWQGKPYDDRGAILAFDRGQRLEFTHFSPLAGKPDLPENYHTVTIELEDHGPATRVTLSQDNNGSDEERGHSEENWSRMLEGLKEVVEAAPAAGR